MKKLIILLLFTVMVFAQSEKDIWEKTFDIASYSKNIINWRTQGLVSSDSAGVQLDRNKSKVIEMLSVKQIEPNIAISPEAKLILDYLKSIKDPSLEKPDIKELWGGLTPIQTSTIWRNDTIRMWMDLNGCDYKNSMTKAQLLDKVKSCLGS